MNHHAGGRRRSGFIHETAHSVRTIVITAAHDRAHHPASRRPLKSAPGACKIRPRSCNPRLINRETEARVIAGTVARDRRPLKIWPQPEWLVQNDRLYQHNHQCPRQDSNLRPMA
jgi:hypothetical protein